MKKQEPIREYKGKKIIRGTWKRRRVDYVSGEIVVAVREDQVKRIQVAEQKEEIKRNLLEQLPKGSRIIRDFSARGMVRIEVPEAEDLLGIIQHLATHPNVEYAEPNIIQEAHRVIPNEYRNLAALVDEQWGLERVRAPWAWDATTGSARVVIAVIDSGIAGPERAPGAIYRWWNPSIRDHFYCSDPMGELAHGGGYTYEGARFRLFPADEANTTPFFRWWKDSTGDHFYTTDPDGEVAPQSGYQLEGNIGNIASIKLPGTVALHRWWEASAGDHFYTTDPNGESAPEVGYQYEGIAGYVVATRSGNLSHPDIADENRFVLGYDYVHENNFPMDDLGHGTHVTGIASADTNNNTGIAALCWNSCVLVIKIFEPELLPSGAWSGQGTSADLADAIIEAVDFGESKGSRVVINVSGGGNAADVVKSAVEYARSKNCLIVASTGNDSDHARGRRRQVRWPAAYSKNYDNVIAVGAIDDGNNLYNRSNVGSQVNVVAPGVDIRSTVPNYWTGQNPAAAAYDNWDGTSMAAPHVSGLAALMLSINGALTPKRVREIMETTADNLGPAGRDDDFGHGRINCERALSVLTGGTIFRWWKASIGDHFYTTDPNGEVAPQSGYQYEGAPFRLFALNTQGTTPFFRWWKASTGDHFYTTDPNGEVAPESGYEFEGNIGNIAIIELARTVALHRWWKASTGDHFYTTDPNGEVAPQSGYEYEGIAGYVIVFGYIANRNTREIHKSDCVWAIRMEESNMMSCDTLDEVMELIRDRGYNGCFYCLSRYDRDTLSEEQVLANLEEDLAM